MPFPNAFSPWTELDRYVCSLLAQRRYRDASEALKDNPITPKSIAGLVADGVRVRLYDGVGGHALSKLKIIGVGEGNGLNGYERDKNLFHEVVHMHYGHILHDGCRDGDGCSVDGISQGERSAITEWIGRRCRAKPELLRSAILGFGLEPRVYDRPSYESFLSNSLGRQLMFSFAEDYFKSVFMD